MGDVPEAQRFREENLDRLADELLEGVAEELRRHRVRELDRALVVDDDHAVGRRVDDADQQLIGELPAVSGDVFHRWKRA